MSSEITSIVATLTTAALLTMIYGYLHAREKERALKFCALAWGVYTLRFVFAIWLTAFGENVFLLIANQTTAILFSVFLFWGACVWARRPVSRLVLLGSMFCFVWLVLSSAFDLPFLWITLPTFAFAGAVSIWTGVVFLGFPRQPGDIGALMAGWTLILWGIHKWDYPSLRTATWFDHWGFYLASIFALATAIGTVLYYFERTRFALSESEERYRLIAEDTPLYVVRTVADGAITFFNDAYRKRLGLTANDYFGQPLSVVAPGEPLADLVRLASRLTPDAPTLTEEVHITHPGADPVWERWTIRTLFSNSGRPAGHQAIGEDITERKRTEDIIDRIHAGTAGTIGEAFFNELTRQLGELLNVRYALAGRLAADETVETMAVWCNGDFGEGFSYALTGTPCADVMSCDTCIFESGVQAHFPQDLLLQEMGVEAYMGTPMRDANGTVSGVLVVMDDKPRPDIASFTRVLEVFAARAGAELSRREALLALQESERHLKILFEEAADAIFVSDNNGNLIEVNAQACKATGYSREELLQLHVTDVDAETTSHEELAKQFGEVVDGEPVTFESRHLRKDGSLLPVELRICSLDTARGKQILGIARDITERLKRESRYQHILKTMMDGYWHLDGNARVTDANAAAANMLGYARDEFLGISVGDIDALESPADTQRRMSALREIGYAQFETVHRRKDGSLIDVEMSVSYLGPEDGGFVAFGRDITDRKRLEEQYRQAQKMEALGQLTGGVAHDFNNLLQVINASVEILLGQKALDSESRELLDSVAAAGDRAARLVSQLLLFSRRQVMRRETLDLNDTVADFIKMLTRIIGEHVRLEWHPQPSPLRIEGDRGMIEQALTNLCVNARDAMLQGGRLHIQSSVGSLEGGQPIGDTKTAPGNYAALRVSDTGCGMSRETLAHIFEPFYTTKGVGEGTGLGLATVYGIMRQHNGYVEVDSVPGQGTTFTLYWPLVETEPTAVEAAHEQHAAGGSETILIAEDEPLVQDVLRRMLERAGYSVILASNGRAAIDFYKDHHEKIDLVILDVVMPELGGYEAYQAMCCIQPRLRALFASGYSEDAIHKDFVLRDGVALITKPYTRNQLLRSVREALDNKSPTS